MTISPYMAIMSHLSDAQTLIEMCSNDAELADRARQEINLAKLIMHSYRKDLNNEVEENEFDNLWKICQERFGR